MKMSEIISKPVRTCTPETWLAQAARLMRSADCEILPVVDSDGRVVGVITDRLVIFAWRSARAIAVPRDRRSRGHGEVPGHGAGRR